MTTEEALNNLSPDQKTQIKHVQFQQGTGQPNCSGETLTIYDYEASGRILSGDLSLAQFPNLQMITFNYNIRFGSLETIDVSENAKLIKIVLGQNSQYSPFQNTRTSLLIKEKHFSQVTVRYYQYDPQGRWFEKHKLLKKQAMIPCCLIEDRKLEQLEEIVEKLNQAITEKDQQIETLKKETEQTPTLGQYQELNNIALPGTDNLDFNDLMQEIKRLKLKDFFPYFQEQKNEVSQLISDAKNKAGDLKTILDLFLQTQKQIVEKEEENDSFTQGQLQGQLTTCQTLLQTKLTQKELQTLLARHKEVLKLERQSIILKQN